MTEANPGTTKQFSVYTQRQSSPSTYPLFAAVANSNRTQIEQVVFQTTNTIA
jgi:hypothetical protein